MSKDEIQLHPTKGLNPHLIACTRCGKDTGEIALLGVNNGVYTCKACEMEHWGFAGRPRHCQRCHSTDFSRKEMYDYDKMPGICKECLDKQKATDTEVEAGGVYFKCMKCGSKGAIKAGVELAAKVREKTGITAPKPVGVELESCPQCEKEAPDDQAQEA